MRKDDRA